MTAPRSRLDPSLGATPEEVVARLTADGLTGSIAALDGARLKTADGGLVRHDDVLELVSRASSDRLAS